MSLRILVTSDFHQREDLKEAAVEEANSGDYDLFLNLGDYMSEEYAEELFEEVECAALGTTGNRDMMFSEEFLESDVPVFNFLEADIDDEYKLILIGGNFPNDIKQEVEELIQDYDSDKVIIGTHYPPKKVGDQIHSGKRVGFDQFREMIIRHKPALWMNGHVHEAFSQRKLMGVPVLNAAATDTGKAFSVEMKDEGGVKNIEEVQLVDK
ncbi:MAG: metallophosphoesterase [Candidatus Nanohalobium sp.]